MMHAMGQQGTAIVVGAGVIGVTSAYVLARNGWDVTVIDRRSEPGEGTSKGNGRQLSYSHTNALASPALLRQIPSLLLGRNEAFRMSLRGRAGYHEWLARFLANCSGAAHRRNTLAVLALARESQQAMHDLLSRHAIAFDYRETGKLVVLRTEQEVRLGQAMLAAKQAAGLNQRLVTREEAEEIEPALRQFPDPLAGAHYAPDDDTGDCGTFAKKLMQLARDSFGARFLALTGVSRLSRRKDRSEVELENGSVLEADLVVAACGDATNLLLAPRGHRLPIQPMKGYSFTAPLGNSAPIVPVTDLKRRLVFTHLGDRMLVAGVAELGEVDRVVEADRLRSMVESARACLPEAAVYSEADGGWAGLRPMTPDTQPIIRMLEPGIAVNAGHGMLGWTLAMGSAERLGALVRESA